MTGLFMAKRFRGLESGRPIRGQIAEHQTRGAGYYECQRHRDPRHGNGNTRRIGKKTHQESKDHGNRNAIKIPASAPVPLIASASIRNW